MLGDTTEQPSSAQHTGAGCSDSQGKVEVAQSCPTLSVHGILQARILEWVAFPFSRGSSQLRDRAQVSRIAGGFFTNRVIREAPCGSAGKESVCNAGDLRLIPGLGRSPGEGKGYPLQYSRLEISMNYIVIGVTKSWTQLSDFHFHLDSW